MGQILVWECKDTGDLFRSEEAYRAHRIQVRKNKAKQKRHEAKEAARKAAIAPLYRCQTFAEVEAWLLSNHELLASDHGRQTRAGGKLVAVHLYDMKWGFHSCSHNAPLGKSTNWHRTDDLPTQYPGWKGRISMRYDRRPSFDAPDYNRVFTTHGVCTGGGSGGGSPTPEYPKGWRESYEVTLWSDDFSLLTLAQTDALVHDIMHFDRATPEYRADNWHNFLGKLEQVRQPPSEPLTAYCSLCVIDRDTMYVNVAARAFAASHPYLVVGGFDDYYTEERLKRDYENYLFLGRAGARAGPTGPRFVCRDIDEVIALKLSGKMWPDTKIIDLKRRAQEVDRLAHLDSSE